MSAKARPSARAARPPRLPPGRTSHGNYAHGCLEATQAKNKTQQKTINTLVGIFTNCLFEAPVDATTFGDPLVITSQGDTPTLGWVLYDACNTSAAVKPAMRHLSPSLARFSKFMAITRA